MTSKETIKLRTRGQITIPKEWLQDLGAEEGDVFVGLYEQGANGRIVLELQKTRHPRSNDVFETYLIADMRAQGLSMNEIQRLLPERRAKLEDAYAKHLKEIEESGEFIKGTDWMKE